MLVRARRREVRVAFHNPTDAAATMSQKDGAIIHVERGYQIAEVLEEAAGASPRFVGYRLLGPDAEGLPVFATEAAAMQALTQFAARRADPATE